jgi:hypothetical protein
MKLVVTGRSLCRRMASRSRRKLAMCVSTENRAKSSWSAVSWPTGEILGGSTSSSEPYVSPQNVVPQAALSWLTSPYRSASQARNAAAETSQ